LTSTIANVSLDAAQKIAIQNSYTNGQEKLEQHKIAKNSIARFISFL
jgi:hypothetical protein